MRVQADSHVCLEPPMIPRHSCQSGGKPNTQQPIPTEEAKTCFIGARCSPPNAARRVRAASMFARLNAAGRCEPVVMG